MLRQCLWKLGVPVGSMYCFELHVWKLLKCLFHLKMSWKGNADRLSICDLFFTSTLTFPPFIKLQIVVCFVPSRRGSRQFFQGKGWGIILFVRGIRSFSRSIYYVTLINLTPPPTKSAHAIREYCLKAKITLFIIILFPFLIRAFTKKNHS